MDNRWRAGALVAVLLAAATLQASPAGAVDDVAAPELGSFSITPSTGDTTSGPATFSVALQVTDEESGVASVDLSWEDVDFHVGSHVSVTRTGGDARNGTWTGSFAVRRHWRAGTYGFHLSLRDVAGNTRSYQRGQLVEQGFPAQFTVTCDDPDTTLPRPTAVRIAPTPVDVREGPATVTFDIDLIDAKSGVQSAFLSVVSRYGGDGGVRPTALSRISGTETEGTWRGAITVPQYAHEGRFRLELQLYDRVFNRAILDVDDLDAAGVTSGFDVLSDQDIDAPRFTAVSVEPAEIDTHAGDQTVTVRVRVEDAKAGIRDHWPYADWHRVHMEAGVVGEFSTTGPNSLKGMARTSGTAVDGEYEATFVVRRGTPPGRRTVRFFAEDAVGNRALTPGADLVAVGGIASLLVYDRPYPPTSVRAEAGDGAATVRWFPGFDGGAPITEYVVRESPDGLVRKVGGDARSVVVDDLRNDVEHTFTVTAVNRAGPSAPSNPVFASPQAVPPPTTTTTTTLPSPPAPPPVPSGYTMVSSTGAVYAFGEVPWLGNAPVGDTPAVDIESTPSGRGYWVVDARGQVFAFGDAPHLGGGAWLEAGETVTAFSRTPSGRGYWTFTSRGRALPFGDARHFGDLGALRLNGPVLDSVATPSGNGYYLVASDGGVFAFGDARFAGSMGNARLNAPVQSLVPDPDGSGYWLVASDGGIFAFEAPFLGSMGGARLNRPVTGMVGSPTGGGYLMVAEDGGIFAFGDVRFHGSLGGRAVPAPITAVAATSG